MQDILPGRTAWESHEYLKDHGHRVAAAEAYSYLAHRIQTDDTYPLPADADTVIAAAATAMQDVHAARQARLEAYAAQRVTAVHEAVAAMQPAVAR